MDTETPAENASPKASKIHPAPVLHAGINLGYGHIKLATPAGDFVTASAYAQSNRLYDGIGRKRNTHHVHFGGKTYEVGSDVINLARSKETVRIPELKWLHTTRYQVFAQLVMDRLALEGSQWNVVIGMPIADFEDAGYREDLENFWKGEHDTASGPITIHNAKLVPEPIGALFSETALLSVSEKQVAAQENHLIIDPGYFTSDWLTLYQLSPDLRQSGGIDIGMHHLLKELSSLLAARYGDTDSDLVSLESLLLEQILHPERFSEDALPLHAMAHEAAETVFTPMIDNLRASVRSWTASSTRSKSILITGGAASFIEKLVKQSWPHIPARVADNAQMANAHGYMEMACMIYSD